MTRCHSIRTCEGLSGFGTFTGVRGIRSAQSLKSPLMKTGLFPDGKIQLMKKNDVKEDVCYIRE